MDPQDFAKIIRTTSGHQVVYMTSTDEQLRPAVSIVARCNGITSTATISFSAPGALTRRDSYFERIDVADADTFLRDLVQRTMVGGS